MNVEEASKSYFDLNDLIDAETKENSSKVKEEVLTTKRTISNSSLKLKALLDRLDAE